MLSSTDQVERTAAAGQWRAFAGYVPSAASGAGAVSGHARTMPSIVIPTTKRHDQNPAQRPEEAVPR